MKKTFSFHNDSPLFPFVNKHTLLMSGSFSVALILLYAMLLVASFNTEREHVIQSLQIANNIELNSQKSTIESTFITAFSDIQFLQSLYKIQHALIEDNSKAQKQVYQDLSHIFTIRKFYNQIQVIKSNGQVALSMNKNDKIVFSPANVSDTNIFKHGMALSQSDIRIFMESPSSKNTSQQPIFFVTKLYDKIHHATGLLVIEYNTAYLFTEFSHHALNPPHFIVFHNGQGNWFQCRNLAQDPTNKETQYFKDKGVLTPQFRIQNPSLDGSFTFKNTLFNYQTLDFKNIAQELHLTSHIISTPNENILFVINVSQEQISTRLSPIQNTFFSLFGFGSSAIIILTYFTVAAWNARIRSEHHAKQQTQQLTTLNDTLAQEVLQRRKAQEQAATERARLVALLDAADRVAIIMTDADGIIQFFNQGAEQLLGYQANEVVHKTTPIIFHTPEEIQALTHDFEQEIGRSPLPFETLAFRAQRSKKENAESLLQKKDGQLIFVNLVVSRLVEDKHQTTTGFIGVAFDVTEKHNVMKALKESAARLNAMSEASHDALALIDDTGTVLYWNKAAEKMFDYTADEALGENIHLLITPPKYRASACIGLRRFAETGQGLAIGNVLEFEAMRKDGSRLFVERAVSSFQFEGKWYAVGNIRDITERKRIEEKLRTSQERLDLALEGGGLGLWDWNITTGEVFFDNRWISMLGYTREDIHPRFVHWIQLIHHDDIAITKDNLNQHIRGDTPVFRAEYRMRAHDGSWKWILALGKVVERDKKGMSHRAVGTHLDITESKKIEQELVESQEVLRATQNIAKVGGWQYDVQTSHLTWTDQVYSIHDLPLGSKLDLQKTLDFYPSEHQAILRNAFQECLQNAVPYDIELELITATRQRKHVRAMGTATQEHNRVVKVSGTLQDITDRKRAEKQLEELRKRLELALTSSDSGLWDWNVATAELYVDDKWAAIHGYTRKELAQHVSTWQRTVHPDDMSEVMLRVEHSHQPDATQLYEAEYRALTKQGELIWILARGRVVERASEGTPLRMIGIIQDITARKILEEQLRLATIEANQASQAKSDFLARMSHEIRTPMNAIIGFSHLALQTALDTRQQDYIVKIQNSAKALLGIINDILDFSKIEAGKLVLEHTNFNLDTTMAGVASVTGVSAEQKGLELILSTAPDVPRHLVGDPLRLSQILLNLTSNAVKFTSSGEVVVSVRMSHKVKATVTLEFCVRDTGIGLTQEEIGRLFESFSQADESTTRKFGGTGLGLTISKRLAELMGGTIWVHSIPGEGSSFYFSADFGLSEHQEHEEVTLCHQVDGKKALVIEENERARQTLVRDLNSFCFTVETCPSKEDVLAKLRSANPHFDFVFMDWDESDVNFFSILNAIRQDRSLDHTKLILLTTNEHLNFIPKVREMGVDTVLIKPLHHSLLLDVISQALEETIQDSETVQQEVISETALNHIRGASLLLVEDNMINQQVAKEILENEGFIVTIAGNGKQALNLLETHTFDAVLMDVQMPEMDGHTATRIIRQNPKFKSLPIIAMTAHALKGDRDKSMAAGMNDHISKPIEPVMLFTCLLEWIPPKDQNIQRPSSQQRQMDVTLPKELPGIDIASGLTRVAQNAGLYKKLLLDFAQSYNVAAASIEQQLASDDIDSALHLLHSIKGVAGNIAANQLAHKASKIEQQLKKNGSIDPTALAGFAQSLEYVIEGIRRLRPDSQEEIPVVNVLDRIHAGRHAAHLLSLIKENSFEAENVLALFKESMGGHAVQQITELSKALDEFDFETAQKITEHIINEFDLRPGAMGHAKP